MQNNIKKYIIILLTLFSTFVYANSLKDIEYRNGLLTLKFEKPIGKVREDFDKKTPTLSIDVKDTEKFSDKIYKKININDKYVLDIVTDYYDNITTFVFYLQTGTKYKIKHYGNVLEIKFIEAQTLPKKNFTIVLDAGHGGHDSGAIGNGYNEKDLALAVTLQLYKNLKRDYNVILTRNNDTFIPLNERAAIGNRANADIFISVHLNASINRGAHGSEVYYFEKNPTVYARERANIENGFDLAGTRAIESTNYLIDDILYGIIQKQSSLIANTVLNSVVSTMGTQKRKVLGANFAVLRGSKSPSILIELGFITNYNDVRRFTSEEGQINVANAIATAIRKHY